MRPEETPPPGNHAEHYPPASRGTLSSTVTTPNSRDNSCWSTKASFSSSVATVNASTCDAPLLFRIRCSGWFFSEILRSNSSASIGELKRKRVAMIKPASLSRKPVGDSASYQPLQFWPDWGLDSFNVSLYHYWCGSERIGSKRDAFQPPVGARRWHRLLHRSSDRPRTCLVGSSVRPSISGEGNSSATFSWTTTFTSEVDHTVLPGRSSSGVKVHSVPKDLNGIRDHLSLARIRERADVT